jgi:DNA-binding GntR family transcriptional regulator
MVTSALRHGEFAQPWAMIPVVGSILSLLTPYQFINSGGSAMPVSPDADWSRMGFDGPAVPAADVAVVPGDPRVLQQLVDDFAGLRDVAWSVSQGSDAFLASALSGGFEGETADALREVVSGRLKAFVLNIARAFSLAGEAVAEYRAVVVAAQQVVAEVVSRAAGLAADDPKVGELKRQVEDQQARVGDAAAVMEAALRNAAQMVSQPIRVPSLWERIRGKVELALSIVGGVLALLSSVVDAPVGLALAGAAFGAGAATLGMTAVDYKEHRAKWWMVLLAGLGVLAPGAAGMVSMEALGAGARAALGGAGLAAAKAAQVLSSPTRWAGLAARGVVGLSGLAARGVMWLPQAVWRGVVALPEALARMPGVIGRDFANVMKWYPGLMDGVGAPAGYVLVNFTRTGLALLTPLRFGDMAQFGFRGAWAALRQRASWSNAVRDFRAGWTGYGARAGRAGVEMLAMLHGLQGMRRPAGPGPGLLLGRVPGTSQAAMVAELAEPPVGPVVVVLPGDRLVVGVPAGGRPVVEGRRWDRVPAMLAVLEKLPKGEFEERFAQADDLLRPLMGMAPVVLGRDVRSAAVRDVRVAALVVVAHALHRDGPVAAQALARSVAEELGGVPRWGGLAGGVRKPRKWKALSQLGDLPRLEEQGVQAGQASGAGEISGTVPGESSVPGAGPGPSQVPVPAVGVRAVPGLAAAGHWRGFAPVPPLPPAMADVAWGLPVFGQVHEQVTELADAAARRSPKSVHLGSPSTPPTASDETTGAGETSEMAAGATSASTSAAADAPEAHTPSGGVVFSPGNPGGGTGLEWADVPGESSTLLAARSSEVRDILNLLTPHNTSRIDHPYAPDAALSPVPGTGEPDTPTTPPTETSAPVEPTRRLRPARTAPGPSRPRNTYLAPPAGWLAKLRRDLEEGGIAGGPGWVRLADVLSTHIGEGLLAPGMRLPMWDELAPHLEITALAVYDAYDDLVAERVLIVKPGEGVWVREPHLEDLPEWVSDLRGELGNADASGAFPVRLAKALRTRILHGFFQPEELLPSVEDLASHLRSRNTSVQRAYAQLATEGLLITGGRNGTRVAPREMWDPAAASRATRAVRAAQSEAQSPSRLTLPDRPQAPDVRREPEPEGGVAGGTRDAGHTTEPDDAADAVPPGRKRARPALDPGEGWAVKKARRAVPRPPRQPAGTSRPQPLGEVDHAGPVPPPVRIFDVQDALDLRTAHNASRTDDPYAPEAAPHPITGTGEPGTPTTPPASTVPGSSRPSRTYPPPPAGWLEELRRDLEEGGIIDSSQQLADALRPYVEALDPHTLLPSGKNLAQKLRLTPRIVFRAYQRLVIDGQLIKDPIIGTLVAPRGSEARPSHPGASGWLEELRRGLEELRGDLEEGSTIDASQQLADALRPYVEGFKPETRMTPGKKLARELGIPRATVQQAYQQLISEGLLITKKGRPWVAPREFEAGPSHPGASDSDWLEELRRGLEEGGTIDVNRLVVALRPYVEAAEPHTLMPPYKKLAQGLEVPHNTADEAYQRLATEGLLFTGGNGTWVAPRSAPQVSRVAQPGAGGLAPPAGWLEELRRDLGRRGIAGGPRWARLADVLSTHIGAGLLPPKTRLPMWDELAPHLETTALAVYDAYDDLAAERVLIVKPGEGVWVREPDLEDLPEWRRALHYELRDPGVRGPFPERLLNALRTRIEGGLLLPGEPLPSAKDLASYLGTSIGTVHGAYTQLKNARLTIIKNGVGTHIAPREKWDPAAIARTPHWVTKMRRELYNGTMIVPVTSRRLADALRTHIHKNHLIPGELLPPYRELAQYVGIRDVIAHRAYALLIGERLLERLLTEQGLCGRIAPREKWDPAAASRATRAVRAAQPEAQPSARLTLLSRPEGIGARREPEPQPLEEARHTGSGHTATEPLAEAPVPAAPARRLRPARTVPSSSRPRHTYPPPPADWLKKLRRELRDLKEDYIHNSSQQLADALHPHVADFTSYTLMPSWEKLGQDLGTAPHTVRRAYQHLIADGLLIKEPNVGTLVAPRESEAGTSHPGASDWVEELRRDLAEGSTEVSTERLVIGLRSYIEAFEPHTRMPSWDELAQRLGIRREMPGKAYRRLATEGLLIAEKGGHTSVVPRSAPQVPRVAQPGAGDLAPPAGWLELLRRDLKMRGTAGGPRWARLADVLSTHIGAGLLPPKTRLPMWDELAPHLETTALAVYDAYDDLAAERVLIVKPGEGVWVRKPDLEDLPEWRRALRHELRNPGARGPILVCLTGALRTRIEGGLLQPEELLPRIKDLASYLGTPVGTVNEAYRQLHDERLVIVESGKRTRVAPREMWDLAAASQAPHAVRAAQPEAQPSSRPALPDRPQAPGARREPEPEPEPDREVTSGAQDPGHTTGPGGAADAVPPGRKRARPALDPIEGRAAKKARRAVARLPRQPSGTGRPQPLGEASHIGPGEGGHTGPKPLRFRTLTDIYHTDDHQTHAPDAAPSVPLDPPAGWLEELRRELTNGTAGNLGWKRLARALRIRIEGGRLEPGTPLPPHEELAQHLGIRDATALMAYMRLTAKGLLLQEGVSGPQVAPREIWALHHGVTD